MCQGERAFEAGDAVTLSVRVRDLVRRYLRYGLHEGICVTVDALGRVNTAPMGVEILDRGSEVCVVIRPYPETRTSMNLRQVPEFTLNFTHDPITFFNSLFHKQSLTLLPSYHVRPPRLSGGIDLVLECEVRAQYRDARGRDMVIGFVIDAYECEGSGIAYSRGASAVIEALVYLTKLAALATSMSCEERMKYFRRISRACSLSMRIGSKELRRVCSAVLRLAGNYTCSDTSEALGRGWESG